MSEDPDNIEDILTVLSICRDKPLGSKEIVDQFLQQGDDMFQDDISRHLLYGLCYAAKGFIDPAEQENQALLDLGYRTGRIYSEIGDYWMKQKEPDKAEGYYKRSLEIKKNWSNSGLYALLLNLGTIERERGDIANAILYAKQAEELAENDDQRFAVFQNLGVLYSELRTEGFENYVTAMQYYHKALAINSLNGHLWVNLGNICKELGMNHSDQFDRQEMLRLSVHNYHNALSLQLLPSFAVHALLSCFDIFKDYKELYHELPEEKKIFTKVGDYASLAVKIAHDEGLMDETEPVGESRNEVFVMEDPINKRHIIFKRGSIESLVREIEAARNVPGSFKRCKVFDDPAKRPDYSWGIPTYLGIIGERGTENATLVMKREKAIVLTDLVTKVNAAASGDGTPEEYYHKIRTQIFEGVIDFLAFLHATTEVRNKTTNLKERASERLASAGVDRSTIDMLIGNLDPFLQNIDPTVNRDVFLVANQDSTPDNWTFDPYQNAIIKLDFEVVEDTSPYIELAKLLNFNGEFTFYEKMSFIMRYVNRFNLYKGEERLNNDRVFLDFLSGSILTAINQYGALTSRPSKIRFRRNPINAALELLEFAKHSDDSLLREHFSRHSDNYVAIKEGLERLKKLDEMAQS